MKCVVIGDIGWEHFYHLGDEAMTEAAVQQLSKRGFNEIILVSGNVEVAKQYYSTEAISRIGFSSKWSRERSIKRLHQIDKQLMESNYTDDSIFSIIKDADLAVIAGGGNINSSFPLHIFERLAFSRIARYFGTPLVVSSQTVGPNLLDEDLPLIGEIINISEAFGAREEITHKQLTALFPFAADKIALTLDDAILLDGKSGFKQDRESVVLDKRYVIASFTAHRGTANLSTEEYNQKLVTLLDALSRELNADIALVPHTGSFDEERVTHDRLLNDKLAQSSASGRIKSLPMLTAQETVDLTQKALLSVSTRYHPTVFGGRAMIPTLGISLSYYSSVRMRGSLRNIGMEKFVVPEICWDQIFDACIDLYENSETIKDFLSAEIPDLIAAQERWWDYITSKSKPTAEQYLFSSISFPMPIMLGSKALDFCYRVTPIADIRALERHQQVRLTRSKNKQIHDLKNRINLLEKQLLSMTNGGDKEYVVRKELDAAIERAQKSEQRKVVRLVDTVADFFRKK